MNGIIRLNRSEMKSIMAGEVYIICENCQNSTCQGWADDCTTGGYEICGPGYAGGGGPTFDCVSVN